MRKTIFSNKRHTTNIDIFFHISHFQDSVRFRLKEIF
jgi:hypothetical protein